MESPENHRFNITDVNKPEYHKKKKKNYFNLGNKVLHFWIQSAHTSFISILMGLVLNLILIRRGGKT